MILLWVGDLNEEGHSMIYLKMDFNQCYVQRKMIIYLLNKLNTLICINMLGLKLQARNPEMPLQENIQSLTRIFHEIKCDLGYSLKESFTGINLDTNA